MRDLILVGVTALVSALGGAFLAMTLNGNTPATALGGSDTLDDDTLEHRVKLLEDAVTANVKAAPPTRDRDTPATPTRAQNMPGETPPGTPDDWVLRRAEAMVQRQRQMNSHLRDAGWTDQEIAALDDMRERTSLEFEQRQYESMRQRRERNPEMFDLWADR